MMHHSFLAILFHILFLYILHFGGSGIFSERYHYSHIHTVMALRASMYHKLSHTWLCRFYFAGSAYQH